MKRHDLMSSLVHETEVTVIGEGVSLDGNLAFSGVVRIYGTLRGKIRADAEIGRASCRERVSVLV